jgi:F0F1-type ATP synthase assembly protein I
MGSEDRKPEAEPGAAEAYRKAGPYLGAVWSLIGSVGVWTAVGLWLDRKFNTAPWLVVVGSLGGMGVGFYVFFKRLSAADKQAREKKQ